jgi:hypothetical protein
LVTSDKGLKNSFQDVSVVYHLALPMAGHPFRDGEQALSLRVASGRFNNRRLEGSNLENPFFYSSNRLSSTLLSSFYHPKNKKMQTVELCLDHPFLFCPVTGMTIGLISADVYMNFR